MSSRRQLLLTPFAASALAGSAHAEERSALTGTWTVTVTGEERFRTWIVQGIQGQDLQSTYGWHDGRQAPVRASLQGRPGQRALFMITPANSEIEAREVAPGRFEGSFKTARGRSATISLVRESESTTPPAQLPTARTGRFIVYIGAPDCPACRLFETPLYMGHYERSPEGRAIPLRRITAYSYRNNKQADWPADLAWMPDRIRQNGTPLFLAVSGRSIVHSCSGLTRWEADMLPLVRRWAGMA
ncbi:hypothetical protein [Sediminicoccus sp. KRV36]|uniref:hypothetical protein n=1 Tax=Sediminicoccus sp. KRV36 TaxID=3133721 RepID=UPI00200E091F|nr:hypothetical protein [Sediminicoccus rosea]UPY36377.1 hypothetical protein LHU95_19490 [Sediminicoccus rosea]